MASRKLEEAVAKSRLEEGSDPKNYKAYFLWIAVRNCRSNFNLPSHFSLYANSIQLVLMDLPAHAYRKLQ